MHWVGRKSQLSPHLLYNNQVIKLCKVIASHISAEDTLVGNGNARLTCRSQLIGSYSEIMYVENMWEKYSTWK